MFYLLKSTRTSAFASFGPGTIVSFGVHAALVIALVVGRSTDASVVETWEEAVDGLTYIAPPNMVSSASETQVRYEASGGADGDASAERNDPSAMRERGSGPGESARASMDRPQQADDAVAITAEDPYENSFTIVEVEEAAERDPESAAPVYPRILMAQGVEGYAAMRFVVDSTGRVDLMSVRVLEATNLEFAVAVKDAMPGMKFTPARIDGRPVRQLAEQVFRFQIVPTEAAAAAAAAASPAGEKSPTVGRQPR